ncbi:hypothetical protein SOVF_056870 [Spinacia oleracea]|nr:hypothetical protein SOVF_056870 [Spinacia oleracea]
MSSISHSSLRRFCSPSTCHCGLPAAGPLKAWTMQNPGRRFIACKFYDYATGRRGCGFFEWVDEGILTNQLLLEKRILQSQVDLLKREISRHEEDKFKMLADIEELNTGVVKVIVKTGLTATQLVVCALASVVVGIVMARLY